MNASILPEYFIFKIKSCSVFEFFYEQSIYDYQEISFDKYLGLMHDSSAQNVYFAICIVKREKSNRNCGPILWHWISMYSESEVFWAFCILSEVYSLWQGLDGGAGGQGFTLLGDPCARNTSKNTEILIQIHRIQIQNQQLGGFVFFTSLIISSVGVVVFKVYNMIRQINLEMNGLLYRINPGVSKINSLLYRAHSW